MKITFCGGARTVTGSSYLLNVAGKKILIDCGMFQGGKRLRERNYGDYPYNPAEIDYIVLSHAHIDHSGLIPRLIKDGFSGRVIATKATASLAGIMLPDSGHIQEMETEWVNRKNRRAGRPLIKPLYSVDDAYASLSYFHGLDYHELYPLTPEVAVKLYDAGHILGSAIIELSVIEDGRQEKIVFSGDLGKPNQPIIRDPDVVEEADYLLLEGTYGVREHEHEEQKLEMLAKVISETVSRGGNIVIPSFAVGRTQEILYYLSCLLRQNKIPNLPIFIDSPLAISATEIFSRHPECFDLGMRKLLHNGEDPFNFPEATYTRTAEESMRINDLPGGALIISASGMCEAGRIKHHLKHNIWRKESTILFVGYQAQGTLGRLIRDGAKTVNIFREEFVVRADIVAIDGFSAHADRSELTGWLGKFIKKPKQVILVHGEEEVLDAFSGHIQEKFGLSTYVPEYLETIELRDPKPSLSSTSQALARMKAGRLLDDWQDISFAFTRRLEVMLDEEEDEERLLQLEQKLADIRLKLAQNL